MNQVVDYYYSLLSTWSYIGSSKFEEVIAAANADVIHKPMNLRLIFQAGGGLPAQERPKQRQNYRLVEMERWRRTRSIPLNIHPKHWPVNPRMGDKMVIAASRIGADPMAFAHACMRAMWTENRDISDRATLVSIAFACDLDGTELMRLAETEEVSRQYDANTDEAIQRQIFGAPTYVYRDELFWGQDRLEHLANALAAPSSAPILMS